MADSPTVRPSPRSLPVLLLAWIAVGAVVGAVFGVGFGALASVFHDGPELWTGIRESWGFFALLGGAMAGRWGWVHRPRATRG